MQLIELTEKMVYKSLGERVESLSDSFTRSLLMNNLRTEQGKREVIELVS